MNRIGTQKSKKESGRGFDHDHAEQIASGVSSSQRTNGIVYERRNRERNGDGNEEAKLKPECARSKDRAGAGSRRPRDRRQERNQNGFVSELGHETESERLNLDAAADLEMREDRQRSVEALRNRVNVGACLAAVTRTN